MGLPADQSSLLRDVFSAINNDEFNDVLLKCKNDNDHGDAFATRDDGGGDDDSDNSHSNTAKETTHDGVYANRFILASRSNVFRKMLYGSFKESKINTIYLNGSYDIVTLQAIVEYCKTNEVTSSFRLHSDIIQRNSTSARRLVQLYHAADYFELYGLMTIVISMIQSLINTYPSLSCCIFDEAIPSSTIYIDALNMILCRPYVTLVQSTTPTMSSSASTTISSIVHSSNHGNDKGGGIECLSSQSLLSLLENKDLQCSELFLFTMLQKWIKYQTKMAMKQQKQKQRQRHQKQTLVQHEGGADEAADNESNTSTTNCYNKIHEIAKICGSKLVLEYIEPQDLLGIVKKSKLYTDTQLTTAITIQALRASTNGVWSLSCRGGSGSSSTGNGNSGSSNGGSSGGCDRILVENAGSFDVNGIYYKIDGLANGELYSKREVACGQQHVYTLSCTIHKDQHVECRIFSSKLLTHQAIRNLSTMKTTTKATTRRPRTNYQPLLQIYHIFDNQDDENHQMMLNIVGRNNYYNSNKRHNGYYDLDRNRQRSRNSSSIRDNIEVRSSDSCEQVSITTTKWI